MRFDEAPELKSVRLDYVFPSEAAPLLAALLSNPNLPALRAVALTVSQEGNRHSPHTGPLAPLHDRRALAALHRRAGRAAAGAASGDWRVEVEREFDNVRHERGLIRAWRR